MITRLSGVLEEVGAHGAVVRVEGSGLCYEVLLPAFFAERLRAAAVGRPITLHTLQYLEGQGQGTSFIPRLIGFATARDRRFFEVFTTVKGLGNKRCLRAMAAEPARIARAVAERDASWLVDLPEIGKRLAETIIAELHGKVEAFLSEDEEQGLNSAAAAEPKAAPPGGAGRSAGAYSQAVAALVALGETRPDAERLVRRAMDGKSGLKTADDILGAVYAGRA